MPPALSEQQSTHSHLCEPSYGRKQLHSLIMPFDENSKWREQSNEDMQKYRNSKYEKQTYGHMLLYDCETVNGKNNHITNKILSICYTPHSTNPTHTHTDTLHTTDLIYTRHTPHSTNQTHTYTIGSSLVLRFRVPL